MAKVVEAQAKITAVDATGRTFEDISKKVRGLSSAMKSLQGITSSGIGHVNKTIGNLQKTMHTLAPVAATAAGAGGMHGVRGLIHETVKATAEQAHEAVRMSVSGMSESDIAEAEKLSGEMSERYRSLSKTTIMHSLRNMRAIVGTYEEAANILDPLLKLRVAAQGAHPEHAEELGEDFDKLIKGMEIKGVTMDPEKFKSYMQGMAKAINVFGDTLRPTDYYEMFKYGRQATQNLSEQFMLETGPTLSGELGGSSGGKAISSFYQAIVGGRIKEQSVKEMEKLGLINEDKVVRTKTGSIKGLLPGGVKGWQLASSDPYAWTNEVLLPALAKKGITSPEAIQSAIANVFQQATAAQMVSIFATQQSRIEKDWNLVHGAKGLEAADTFQAKDPFIAWSGVTEQFKNLLAIAGGPLAGPAAAGMNAIAEGIVALEKAATDHPKAAAAGLLGGTTIGAGLAGWLTYKGLRGLGGLFGWGGAAAAEEASGGSMLGSALRWMGRASAPLGAAYELSQLGGDTPQGAQADWMRNWRTPGGWDYTLGSTGGFSMRPGSTSSSSFSGGRTQGFAAPSFDDSTLGGALTAQAPAPAEVKGSADLNVNVQIEPSDSFISRIVQAIRNEINVFASPSAPGSGVGTSGSTGLSMPEVIAPP